MHPIALVLFTLLGCPTTTKPVDTGEPPAQDADGDGFLGDEDCNDEDASINPNASEVCDGQDNDCDGQMDEGVASTYYRDADEDGYGSDTDTVQGCEKPDGYILVGGDCDDSDGDVNYTATEKCDGKDNNCDGTVDEGVKTTWYADADADGFGDLSSPVPACDQPSGTSWNA